MIKSIECGESCMIIVINGILNFIYRPKLIQKSPAGESNGMKVGKSVTKNNKSKISR